jgi:hypothetical protein
MKKTILILALFIATTSCNKDEEPAETNITTATQDLTSQLEGIYTGTGKTARIAPPTIYTITQVKIERIATNEISISSPEGLFQSFTLEDFAIDYRDRIICTQRLSDLDFDPITKRLELTNNPEMYDFIGTKN